MEVAVVVVVLDLHPPGEPGIELVQPGPDRLGEGQVLLRVGVGKIPHHEEDPGRPLPPDLHHRQPRIVHLRQRVPVHVDDGPDPVVGRHNLPDRNPAGGV